MGKSMERHPKREGGRTESDRIPSPLVLFFNDGFNRADLSTRPTLRAFFLIDHIGFAFFDCFDRTFLCAGSTGHAFIGNHISHFNHPLHSNFENLFFLGC